MKTPETTSLDVFLYESRPPGAAAYEMMKGLAERLESERNEARQLAALWRHRANSKWEDFPWENGE